MTITLGKNYSESDLFPGVSDGKTQTKRSKSLMSCHSEVTARMFTADNLAEAPAGLRTLTCLHGM